MVHVLELCLDADSAGQDAMLRAARLAAGRNLELRVVPLPVGADPADLATSEGPDALRERVKNSVPFVVFQVDRILDRADTRSAEGRDKALGELRPVIAEVPPSVVREELVRRVAGRLELSEARLAALIAGGGGGSGGSNSTARHGAAARAPAVDHGARLERMFLVLCVALPEAGREALAAIDPDEHLTTSIFRRAARHLAARTESPLADLPPDDDELARAISDLVARAGRVPDPRPERLEHARLVLELARIDRAIVAARAARGMGVTELSKERDEIQGSMHALMGRLDAD
jgi:DNA primase